MVEFDHARIDKAEPLRREDSRSVMVFTYLVMDYMEHLESIPIDITTQQHQREEKSAIGFVNLVDTDDSWPIARQYMFTGLPDPNVNTKHENQYLARILNAVEHRTIEPTIAHRRSQIQKWEANMLWNRLKGHVEFIASLSGPIDVERKQELANTLTVLRGVFPLEPHLAQANTTIVPGATDLDISAPSQPGAAKDGYGENEGAERRHGKGKDKNMGARYGMSEGVHTQSSNGIEKQKKPVKKTLQSKLSFQAIKPANKG